MHKALVIVATLALLGASLLPTVALAQSAYPSLPASLVPPADLEPFSDLPVTDIEGDSTSYRVVYGPMGDASATIAGRVGTDDAITGLFFPAFTCASTALYCTATISGRDGTPPGSEIFHGLAVNGQPASAIHINCCAGVHWAVQWYDTDANVTYALELDQAEAVPYGDMITPKNLAAAQRLAGLAAQLIPAST